MKRLPLFLVAIALSWAHDLQLSTGASVEAVVVVANYGGTAAASFAQFSVYSPAKPQTEFQTGRLDALGRFAFLPNAPGRWRIVVDDEMGHRQETTVDWAATVEAPLTVTPQPAWQKALTGVSLLLGLTGCWLWWRVRQRV